MPSGKPGQTVPIGHFHSDILFCESDGIAQRRRYMQCIAETGATLGHRKISRASGRAAAQAIATVLIAVQPFAADAAPGQTATPDTITPRSLAPTVPQRDLRVEIPEGGALQPPKGAESLVAGIGAVELIGGFPEVADQTAIVVERLRNGRHTLAEIYAAASEIEAIHARAGFVLARVSVPPQKLNASATLRFVVTDGFIEAVDVGGVPARVREPVRRATAAIAHHRHLRMRDIEQALVIANDVPGLTLRSTLARGTEEGGARLILEGSHDPVSVQLGANNAYDSSLGTYAVSAEIALNSLLGQGETIYGYLASQYDVSRFMGELAPASIAGGGAVLRPGDGRWTINPEIAVSRTRPAPFPGAPQTVGKLRRLSLRAGYALQRARSTSGGVQLSIEQIEQTNDAPDFQVRLSHDRFVAARVGLNWSHGAEDGKVSWAGSIRVSQGLGGLGGITREQSTAAGVPLSRIGATPSFTNVAVSGSLSQAAGPIAASLQVRAQGTFGRPQLRSEQFSMEGADGLSAYVGGFTTVDEGAVGRITISPRKAFAMGKRGPFVQPYGFSAIGTGRIDQPSRLEPDGITAFAGGAGLKLTCLVPAIQANVEYARGVSSYAPLDRIDRLNLTISLRI